MPTIPRKQANHNPPATKAKWMNREQDNAKFYNSAAWRKVSKMFLQRNPLCVRCKEQGLTVEAKHSDHIVEINDGGATLSFSNLQPLCIRHHNIKTTSTANARKR